MRVWSVLCDPGLRGLVVPRGASGVVDVEEVEVRETLALFRSLPTSVIRDVCFTVGMVEDCSNRLPIT